MTTILDLDCGIDVCRTSGTCYMASLGREEICPNMDGAAAAKIIREKHERLMGPMERERAAAVREAKRLLGDEY